MAQFSQYNCGGSMKFPSAFTGKEKLVNTIVETPRGSAYKYKFDEKYRLFKLSKMLPAGMVFPIDMGFIPGTKGGDGDPLDVLIMMENSTWPGCLIECRLLGIIEATQARKGKKEKRNDRIIAVPESSIEYSDYRNLDSLDKHKLEDLMNFFSFYNQVENKNFKVIDVKGPKHAFAVIKNHAS